jgi:hypothetical protein
VEDRVTKRETRSLPEKTKDMALAAGEAIGQAALTVTHLAINRTRAAVALADHAIYGPSAAKSKRGTVKKRVARLAGKVVKKARRAK